MSSERFLHVDAGNVRWNIERLLAAYPELAEDEDLRADVLEGETEIDSVLTRLFLSWRTAEEAAAGAKAIKADLDARQKRHEDNAKKAKAIALAIMDAADLPKRVLPVASLSVSSGRKRVVVDDVNELPQGAYTLERKPVTAKELEAMMVAMPKGETFPGAHLEIGPDYLTARAK